MRADLPCAICGVLLVAGCGKSPAVPDGTGPPLIDAAPTDALVDVPPHMPGTPGAGAHGLAYYKLADPRYPSNATSISTPKITTAASGSTIVVSVGRGDISKFAAATVTDTAGNTPYQKQGPHPYTPAFPDSGTALYTFTNARGGPNFQVTTSTGRNANGQLDEITIAAVEVVEGTRIQDQQWNEVVQAQDPVPVTSNSVTTTGPATLVAFWWGDGFPGTPQSATPGNGFSLIDSNAFETDSFVQCAVAVKNVSTAGTYHVTWTSTPIQGAQLW
ncbi:MAG TPA: hypothetical protein VF516_39385, partial [Kofleriaceae bacterium]